MSAAVNEICKDGLVDIGKDLQMYYRDIGSPSSSSNLPIVCLPGLTRNSLDFSCIAAWLGDKRRVICPDLRGRGRSDFDPDWRNYHPATYVSDVWRLLDHLGVHRCIVIGTSLGGIIAMLMTSERPERIAGIVLNDIGPELDPVGVARISAAAGRLESPVNLEKAIIAVRQAYKTAFPDWDNAQWVHYTKATYKPFADGLFELNYDTKIGDAVRAGVSAVQDNPWAIYDALRPVPALLIHGALSDLLTTKIIDKMLARKPDLVTLTVSNRGHAPSLDEPEVRNAIDEFLQ